MNIDIKTFTLVKICSIGEFKCKSGECLSLKLQCNGNNDCPDKSDEESCAEVQGNKTLCSPGMWQCNDGDCIRSLWKCDGTNDCADGSDEKACCKEFNFFAKFIFYDEKLKQEFKQT